MADNIMYIPPEALQARVWHHPIRQPVQAWPLPDPGILQEFPVCTTPLPAHFCACGAYLLLEEEARYG
jgi:hypothetical protein